MHTRNNAGEVLVSVLFLTFHELEEDASKVSDLQRQKNDPPTITAKTRMGKGRGRFVSTAYSMTDKRSASLRFSEGLETTSSTRQSREDSLRNRRRKCIRANTLERFLSRCSFSPSTTRGRSSSFPTCRQNDPPHHSERACGNAAVCRRYSMTDKTMAPRVTNSCSPFGLRYRYISPHKTIKGVMPSAIRALPICMNGKSNRDESTEQKENHSRHKAGCNERQDATTVQKRRSLT